MPQDTQLPWITFLARNGEEGSEWVVEYERGHPIVRLCADSVSAMRSRRLVEGNDLLERAGTALEALDGLMEASVRMVVERWFHAAVGFEHYCHGRYDDAGLAMNRAHAAIVAAIDRKRCLTPLAMDCYEVEMHRARIARERGDWLAMRLHGYTAARMRTGQRPFCTLSDATSIGLAEVRGFYLSIPGLSPAEREALAHLVDDAALRFHGEREVRNVMRIPGFVIHYP